MFEPDSTWSNIYDFENFLAKFLKSQGYEGQIIDAIKGSVGRRVIFVRKITDLLDDPSKNWRKPLQKGK